MQKKLVEITNFPKRKKKLKDLVFLLSETSEVVQG